MHRLLELALGNGPPLGVGTSTIKWQSPSERPVPGAQARERGAAQDGLTAPQLLADAGSSGSYPAHHAGSARSWPAGTRLLGNEIVDGEGGGEGCEGRTGKEGEGAGTEEEEGGGGGVSMGEGGKQAERGTSKNCTEILQPSRQ